jgi:hypothetical protein
MDWTEWLGVAIGILLFRYTASYRRKAQAGRAANSLEGQADRVWTSPPDAEQNYTHAHHAE